MQPHLTFISSHATALQVLSVAEDRPAAQPYSFGLWSDLVGGSQEGSMPVSSAAEQTEDEFYFSEHIRSCSTAYCQLQVVYTVSYLGLLVKEGCNVS